MLFQGDVTVKIAFGHTVLVTIASTERFPMVSWCDTFRLDRLANPVGHSGRTANPVRGRNGRRGRDRTCNPQLRRLVLYPIELLARVVLNRL